jgi:hypothetical protein
MDQIQEPRTDERQAQPTRNDRQAYVPPRVTVMNEAEILKAFQFTSAASSWWVM